MRISFAVKRDGMANGECEFECVWHLWVFVPPTGTGFGLNRKPNISDTHWE